MNQSFDPLLITTTGVQLIEASADNRKIPFDRLRANGSSLEIILVPSAPAGPVVSFAPAELKVYSAHAEPVEAPMMNDYYEPIL